MSASSSSQRSTNGGLLLVGTTSTIALGLSIFLWRSVRQLQLRIEELEAHRQHEARRKSPTKAKRLSHDGSSATKADDADHKDGARSLLFDGTTGETPPPEVVVGENDALPTRFLNAGKGDAEKGRERFLATLAWREENEMNTALYRAWPDFELIKQHYPHFFHATGKKGEPVFFEQPPKTDLKALRMGGVDLQGLLNHYAMICEYQWQYVTRDDTQKSIYIIDLEGMGMSDFVGECKDFVHEASAFASAHYPERAGVVLVINVPYWFKMVWNVVSKWVDEVTLKKIFILRGKDEILQTLSDKIPMENIPPEYGGLSSFKLGESLEEQQLRELMAHNNDMADGQPCPNATKTEPCRFCNFRYARNY